MLIFLLISILFVVAVWAMLVLTGAVEIPEFSRRQEISGTQIGNASPSDQILLRIASTLLQGADIPHYLDCGTLLGVVRDQDIIAPDKDLDITCHLDDWPKMEQLLKEKAFQSHGLKLKRVRRWLGMHPAGNMISLRVAGAGCRARYMDIYFNPWFPRLTEMEFIGQKWPVPENPEMYIAELYGDDWRVPQGRHASERFHRGNGLMHSGYAQKYADPGCRILPSRF
ncbi:MAG: LicD family protein [Gammaproteobacteria bacterium]|nr:LicD family protein [Gammaproteobacteria bacterium]